MLVNHVDEHGLLDQARIAGQITICLALVGGATTDCCTGVAFLLTNGDIVLLSIATNGDDCTRLVLVFVAPVLEVFGIVAGN